MIFSFTCVFIPKGSNNVSQLPESLSAPSNADYSHSFALRKEGEINHRISFMRFQFGFGHILKIEENEQI
jgi:hypothetical protein